MKYTDYEKIIEAVLFASGEAVSLRSLSRVLELDTKDAQKLVQNLMDTYEREERGLLIKEIGDSYQLCTNPRYFDYILKLEKVPSKKGLTQPLMETLAIIAYKQPITKSQIEDIRGVNPDHAVNKLLECGLICETGRQDAPGKPILFGTSQEFLRHFNLAGLHQLPEYDAPKNSFSESGVIPDLSELKNETEIGKHT